MENKLKLSIEGMHCVACTRRVTNALNNLEGVRADAVEVGSASVTFDEAKVSPEQILAAVDNVGFNAKCDR